MLTNTITILAMLKVNIDQGKDYLDYLRPFILQVLVEYNPADPITDGVVSRCIRDRFGIEIPRHVVQLVLRRIAKDHFIEKDGHVYRKTDRLPDPQIAQRQSEAERHIESVVEGLRNFSQDTGRPLSSDEDAVNAICSFLARFSISCLRTYLRGTALPNITGTNQTEVVLVSNYVQRLQRCNPERFDSFILLLQGHMLANALVCSDIPSNLSNYRNVTFYLDTPLIIQMLGFEGHAKQTAARELIALLKKLKGDVAIFFSH